MERVKGLFVASGTALATFALALALAAGAAQAQSQICGGATISGGGGDMRITYSTGGAGAGDGVLPSQSRAPRPLCRKP